MSLGPYKAKRKLQEVPEPAAKKKSSSSKWTFVIQKHDARQLHYDLRLEMDGVLKSWAVPKGPPMEPAVKRLAIQVEDHPLAYGSFEGVIPKGHYGAGTVEIWDKGTYSVEGKTKKEQDENIHKQFDKGHLNITFSGKKMHGRYHLVRMAGDEDGKQWLFIKSQESE